jgi:hypothetical protein
MFEKVVGVVTILGVLIGAADFTLRWLRKPPPKVDPPRQDKVE